MVDIALKGGDEFAAITTERRHLAWKAGERRAAKKSYARRARKNARRAAIDAALDQFFAAERN